jgi:hypothetical protein
VLLVTTVSVTVKLPLVEQLTVTTAAFAIKGDARAELMASTKASAEAVRDFMLSGYRLLA